ncbi:MAG TPA: hypothetical protein VK595_12060 [Vicinamibacterales bacterium]|nr:hypothetical protein [Vicinamibacterales bacterium]
MTIGGVKYRSGESGALGRRASDKELPPATLSCEVASVQLESHDSVSEGVQSGREVASVWCRNVLADHPPWAESPGHGEEVSGEVGVLRGPITARPRTGRAGISSAENINCRCIGVDELSDVGPAGNARPMAPEDGTARLIALALPEDGSAGVLEPEFQAADPGEEACTGQHPIRLVGWRSDRSGIVAPSHEHSPT